MSKKYRNCRETRIITLHGQMKVVKCDLPRFHEEDHQNEETNTSWTR